MQDNVVDDREEREDDYMVIRYKDKNINSRKDGVENNAHGSRAWNYEDGVPILPRNVMRNLIE